MKLTDQPAWAASLGIKLEGTVDEDLPEWLSEDIPVPSYEGEQIAPFVEEEIETQGAVDAEGEAELIPEWMKEAGWQPQEGEVQAKVYHHKGKLLRLKKPKVILRKQKSLIG
jgi:hypothetical protein